MGASVRNDTTFPEQVTALPPCPPGTRKPIRSRSTASHPSGQKESIFDIPPRTHNFRFGSRDGSARSTPKSTPISTARSTARSTATPTPRSVSPNHLSHPQRDPLSAPPRTSSRQAVTDAVEPPWYGPQDILARHLFYSHRKLRSQSSKLSLSSQKTGSTIDDSLRSDLQRTRSVPGSRVTVTSPKTPISPPISSPSQFQHMTHIRPEEFQRLANANEDDLAASFSAMRASQTLRRDLRGIKALDIHSRNTSVETTTTSPTASDSIGSAQVSSNTSRDSSARASVLTTDPIAVLKQPKSHVRAQRSQDSFSQPFVRHRPSKFVTPQSISSRSTVTHFDTISSPSNSSPWTLSPSNSFEEMNERFNVSTRPSPQTLASEVSRVMGPQSLDKVSDTREAWPLSIDTQSLQSVEEEKAEERPLTAMNRHQAFGKPPSRPPRTPLPPVPSQNSSVTQLGSFPSSASSSGDSNITVTAESYADELRAMTATVDKRPLPSWSHDLSSSERREPVKREHVKREPMKRSPITGGLFTGWIIDESEEVFGPPALADQFAKAEASYSAATRASERAKEQRIVSDRAQTSAHDIQRHSKDTRADSHYPAVSSSGASKSANSSRVRYHHSHNHPVASSGITSANHSRIRQNFSSALPTPSNGSNSAIHSKTRQIHSYSSSTSKLERIINPQPPSTSRSGKNMRLHGKHGSVI